jgi:sRNA-binding protein
MARRFDLFMLQRPKGSDGATCATGPEPDCIPGWNVSVLAENSLQPQEKIARRELETTAATLTITVLAELFPAAFVVERWVPHKPLKVGIDRDLVALGILTEAEVSQALRRLQYQRSLAAGGFRFDLDGNAAGEVAPSDITGATAMVARIEARVIAKAEEAKAKIEAKHLERQAKHAGKSAPAGTPSQQSQQQPQQPRRLGLADLRRAAAARRIGGAP